MLLSRKGTCYLLDPSLGVTLGFPNLPLDVEGLGWGCWRRWWRPTLGVELATATEGGWGGFAPPEERLDGLGYIFLLTSITTTKGGYGGEPPIGQKVIVHILLLQLFFLAKKTSQMEYYFFKR